MCDYVPLQQQAVNAGVTTTWTIVDTTKEEDLFPELEGPVGVEDPKVIQACEGVDYLGAPGDKLNRRVHVSLSAPCK